MLSTVVHADVPAPGRRRRRRALVLSALFLVLASLAASCSKTDTATTGSGGTAAPSGPVTVRLGYFANITHAPALVGLQKDFFKTKLGANTLETKVFNAGPAAVEALFGDALDITYVGPNPSINAYQKSNGDAVRIVSGSTSGGAYFVVNQSINSAQDLKGKTVSSPQLGNTQDVALRTWLKGQGFSTDTAGGGDVSIKPQENADTLTSFKNGDIVGAWVPEPWATRLIQEGNGKVLVDEKTLWPDGKFDTTNILVSKKFLEAHPDVVKEVLEAHLQSLDYIKASPDDAQKLANAQIEKDTQKKLSDKVIAASWKNLEFTYDPLAASVQKSADDAKATGQLKSSDIKGIYDLAILNSILKAQNLADVQGLA